MKNYFIFLIPFVLLSCMEKTTSLDAQAIVDKSIEVSGGEKYKSSDIAFRFRDREYILEQQNGERVFKRIQQSDSGKVTDVLKRNSLKRYLNEVPVQLSDSMATVYGNSVNSVHYFAYLPYGLNDPAVKKELLGEKHIKDRIYYKIKVSFEQEGGGNDFEDIYVYWIDKETFKPTYLAYEFHVDGGGVRFREAINERYINGIRFVDYLNYKPLDGIEVTVTDSLYITGKLELLSKIILEDIRVNQDNYN